MVVAWAVTVSSTGSAVMRIVAVSPWATVPAASGMVPSASITVVVWPSSRVAGPSTLISVGWPSGTSMTAARVPSAALPVMVTAVASEASSIGGTS